jgi:hypothetical protein
MNRTLVAACLAGLLAVQPGPAQAQTLIRQPSPEQVKQFETFLQEEKKKLDASQPAAGQFRALRQTYEAEERVLEANDWKDAHGIRVDSVKRTVQFIARLMAVAEAHPQDPATLQTLLWLNTRFFTFAGLDQSQALLRQHWPDAGAYLDVLNEHRDAENAYREALMQARNDEARARVYEEHYPKPGKFTGRQLAIARKDPASPLAFACLQWVIENGRQGADVEAALELALQHHVGNPEIGALCESLAYSPAEGAEGLLRAVVKENSDHQARGLALLHLAIGKVAPEIEGEDMDGVKFKLSDYRGRVVVIDFWGDW